jgi:hypothetical protein
VQKEKKKVAATRICDEHGCGKVQNHSLENNGGPSHRKPEERDYPRKDEASQYDDGDRSELRKQEVKKDLGKPVLRKDKPLRQTAVRSVRKRIGFRYFMEYANVLSCLHMPGKIYIEDRHGEKKKDGRKEENGDQRLQYLGRHWRIHRELCRPGKVAYSVLAIAALMS